MLMLKDNIADNEKWLVQGSSSSSFEQDSSSSSLDSHWVEESNILGLAVA